MRLAWMALAFWGLWAGLVWAHEVRPTIGDLSARADRITLALDLNVEAFLAGINLDGLEDINNTPQSQEYDTLRALPAEQLAERFAPLAQQMSQEIGLVTPAGPGAWRVADIDIGPTGNVETLRESRLTLVADLADPDVVDVGWPAGYGVLILRQIGVARGYTGFVEGGGSSGPIALVGLEPPGLGAMFLQNLSTGFDHVLPRGLDHILFMLGLVIVALPLGVLAWHVAALTLGHLTAVAVAAFGLMTLPASVAAPLIALLIVYIGLENVFAPREKPGRPFAIYAFGLLHGLAFASTLDTPDQGMGSYVVALVSFNLGLELGQLTVMAMTYALIAHWFADRPWYRTTITIPVSVAIAAVGMYWVIERSLMV